MIDIVAISTDGWLCNGDDWLYLIVTNGYFPVSALAVILASVIRLVSLLTTEVELESQLDGNI